MAAITDSVLASCIARIGNEMGRLEELRSKNRNVALVVGGAIISFSMTLPEFKLVLFANAAAFLVAVVHWFQDFQFHKYRHGWHGVDKRIRYFINGELPEEKLELMIYRKQEEKDYTDELGIEIKGARIFSKSSSFTFLVIIIGAIGVIALRIIYPDLMISN